MTQEEAIKIFKEKVSNIDTTKDYGDHDRLDAYKTKNGGYVVVWTYVKHWTEKEMKKVLILNGKIFQDKKLIATY